MPVLDYSDPRLPTPTERMRPALGYAELLLPAGVAWVAGVVGPFVPIVFGLLLLAGLVSAVVVTARLVEWRRAARTASSAGGPDRPLSRAIRVAVIGGLLLLQFAGLAAGCFLGVAVVLLVRGRPFY